jgi:hypothetical protein
MTQATKSWAQRGKEAVAATVAPQFNVPEGFKRTGGGNAVGSPDRAVLTYRFSQPRNRPLGEDEQILNPGDTILGKYIGSYQDSFKKTYFKIIQSQGPNPGANGKVVAIHGVKSLSMRLENVALETETFIGYIGLGVAKPGMNAPYLVDVQTK